MKKTNAMRLLDQAGITYNIRSYSYDPDDLSGQKAAQALHMPEKNVYKTLVVHGDRSGFLVCCLAADSELDLKRVAVLVNSKRAEMIPVSQILPLTGYVRGGCSPLAMKKKLPTYIDSAVTSCELIAVSAGQRGLQIIISPQDLIRATDARLAVISVKA